METRGRAKLRATTSPPRAATVGGTQPEMGIVGLPSSATGQPRDGRISPRSSSLEAGPRRTCQSIPRSESVGEAQGPAQGVMEVANQGTAGLVDSHTVAETTTDEGQISTHTMKRLVFSYFAMSRI